MSIKPGPKMVRPRRLGNSLVATAPHSDNPSLKTLTTQFFLGSFGLSVSQQFGLPPNERTEISEVPVPRPNGGLVPVVGMDFSDWQLRAKSGRLDQALSKKRISALPYLQTFVFSRARMP